MSNNKLQLRRDISTFYRTQWYTRTQESIWCGVGIITDMNTLGLNVRPFIHHGVIPLCRI